MVPGAGADEIILLTAQLALGRGDMAIVAKPTYQLYAVASATAGARLEAVAPRGGLGLDCERLLARAPGARLVWLCSPNNPTGEEVPRAGERALRRLPGLVVVDQAYLELGGEDLAADRRHENLVVCAHLLQGLGPRRPRRLRAAGPGPWPARSMRCGRRARSRSQTARAAELASRPRAEMREDAAAYGPSGTVWPPACAALDLEVLAEAGNFVTFRTPSTPTRRSPGSPRAAAWCARSATSRCCRA